MAATDNIVPMPTSLDRLAGKIRDALERREHGRAEWIEATLDLCQHLAEARAQHPSNAALGEWCEANGLGHDVLNKNDRAAAIEMGQHLAEMRAVLEKTERRSLRYIHKEEFRLPYIGKTELDAPNKNEASASTSEASPPKKKRGRSSGRKVTPDKEEAIARAVLDDGKTLKEAGQPYGVSDIVSRLAVAREEGRREGPPPDPATLSKSKQEEYERAVRAAEARIRREVETEISERYQKIWDDTYLAEYTQKKSWAERILASHKGVMTKDEFKILLRVVHPDNSASGEVRGKAFQILTRLEDVLVKPEEEHVVFSTPLPRTVAEMLAQKRTKTR